MATNNEVGTSLFGQIATGSFVGSVSPTLTTPTIGVATATTITFVDPSTGGIIGTGTNDNASSGIVGEFMSSVVPFASAVSAPNNTTINVTSLTLPSGDWDIEGNISLNGVTGFTIFKTWASLTSASQPSINNSNAYRLTAVPATIGNCGLTIPPVRSSANGSTTWFLSCLVGGSTGTITACGGIYARRPR